jgi:hypothetical protein
MSNSLNEFISYLENLASLNTDINHDAQNNPAFVKFYEAENIDASIRNKIKNVPCVIVKDYDFFFRDNKSDNLHKVREIEFIIVHQIGRGGSDVYGIWEYTEEVGDEFIVKMKSDKRNINIKAIAGFDLDGVKGVPVDLQVSGLFGTSYTIPISSYRSNDINPQKWR